MLTSAVLLACGQPAARTPAAADADSLVLERTQCFGTCPAYRVSVTRAGLVSFRSRNPGDSTSATARVSITEFTQLVAEADRAGLRTLPREIRADSALCPLARTDAPTVSTSLFAGDRVTRVERYTGCARSADVPQALPPALERLRQFEDRVDSVAGSARWVRPATRR
jgi:hypothetical protein